MKQSPAALCSSRCHRSAWAALLGILWLSFAAAAAADFPTDPASVRERQLLLQVIEELELLLQSVRRAERNTGVGAVERFHYPALLQDLQHMRDGVLNYLRAPSRIPRPLAPLRRVYSAIDSE